MTQKKRRKSKEKMKKTKNKVCTGTLYRKHVEAVNLAEQMVNGKWQMANRLKHFVNARSQKSSTKYKKK